MKKSFKKKNEEEQYVQVGGLDPKLIFFSLCDHFKDVTKDDLQEIWEERIKTKDYYFKRIRKEDKFDHGLEIDLTHLMTGEKFASTTISSKKYNAIYHDNPMQEVIKKLYHHKAQTAARLYAGKNIRITQEDEIKSDILTKKIQIEEVDESNQVKSTMNLLSLQLRLNQMQR